MIATTAPTYSPCYLTNPNVMIVASTPTYSPRYLTNPIFPHRITPAARRPRRPATPANPDSAVFCEERGIQSVPHELSV